MALSESQKHLLVFGDMVKKMDKGEEKRRRRRRRRREEKKEEGRRRETRNQGMELVWIFMELFVWIFVWICIGIIVWRFEIHLYL